MAYKENAKKLIPGFFDNKGFPGINLRGLIEKAPRNVTMWNPSRELQKEISKGETVSPASEGNGGHLEFEAELSGSVTITEDKRAPLPSTGRRACLPLVMQRGDILKKGLPRTESLEIRPHWSVGGPALGSSWETCVGET